MTTKKVAETQLERSLIVRVPGDVPRMRDEDLGRLLAYARPRKVREQIVKELKSKNLNDFDVCPTQGRVTATGRPRKDGTVAPQVATQHEYWLTKRAALFVAARSDTQKGAEILTYLIALYEAAAADDDGPDAWGQTKKALGIWRQARPVAVLRRTVVLAALNALCQLLDTRHDDGSIIGPPPNQLRLLLGGAGLSAHS